MNVPMVLAYADGLIIISENRLELARFLNEFIPTAGTLMLEINDNKRPLWHHATTRGRKITTDLKKRKRTTEPAKWKRWSILALIDAYSMNHSSSLSQ